MSEAPTSPGGCEALAPLRAGILIGGRGSRMGAPKHLLEFAGRTFLEHVHCATAQVAPSIRVLGRGDLPRSLRDLRRVDDAPDARGPMAGLLAALRTERGCAWLLVGCDMPLVTPAAVRWLIAQRSLAFSIVMPRTSPGRLEPLLAVYEPDALKLVEELAARNENSLRALGDAGHVSKPTVPPELRGAWTNINDRGELSRLR